MIKIIAFGVALLLFVLCAGCGSASTLKHLGSSQIEAAPNTCLPQIMLDGVIYYLNGESPVIEVAEADISGRIWSTVPLTQKPVEDGQANFNVEQGAPYAEYEQGIAVLWNKKWVLFVTGEELLNATISNSQGQLANASSAAREIKAPKQLIGTPDRIILMKGSKETTFEPDTQKYNEILAALESRFPEKFHEASHAFSWLDDNAENIDWVLMSQDFNYLRLAYDTKQQIKISCFSEGYTDYAPEISFQNITFPLTAGRLEPDGGFTKFCIIESGKFLGKLDNAEEILEKLLAE